MRLLLAIWCGVLCLGAFKSSAQDTTVIWDATNLHLPHVILRSNENYKDILERIKNDTTFYKAFKNLRIINYSAYNTILMRDKKGNIIASYQSKTKQTRKQGCRSMTEENRQVSGDFFTRKGDYNYTTAKLYASLFFTKGTICGEDNIIKGNAITTNNKKGLDKHREQLKMLFFNPGKKIPGIPFIGDKLDVYDERAHKYYSYRLDYIEYEGKWVYLFTITPKDGSSKGENMVVDEMATWFDPKDMRVLARNYRLSYKAGVYDFDVQMEVKMMEVGGMLIPSVLRYKGNWDIVFQQRERGEFTATITNPSIEP
ncbi:MAG: hypothetical protein ACK4HE_02955 [Chitinophagaceae bacterium]